MTLSEATTLVRARGFEVRPQIPHYGEESNHCVYLSRTRDLMTKNPDVSFRAHYYVLLVAAPFEDRFLEAVYEIYAAPKETRRPKGKDVQIKGDPYTEHQHKGFLPIYATIVRDAKSLSTL